MPLYSHILKVGGSFSMTNRRPKIIIDLDRTLLDSDALHEAMFQCCERQGIPRIELQTQQERIRKESPLFCFYRMVEEHAINIQQDLSVLQETLRRLIDEDCSRFLFTDSLDFLERGIAYGWDCTLLTYGEHEFQSRKIRGSGLDRICHRTIVTQRPKWELPHVFRDDRVLFIDDNSENIDRVKECFPHVFAIAVKRPLTKYANYPLRHADSKVCSLTEIDRVLLQI